MSNNGQISFEIYKWLSSLNIITTNQKYKTSGNIQLDSKLHDQLLSGSLIALLLEKISNQMKITLNAPLLSSIKKSNTPATRVYNWNILNDSFIKLGINLSKQMQKQITSGNFQQLNRFLIEIHRKIAPKVKKFIYFLKKFQHSSSDIKNQSNNEHIQINFKKIESYKTYEQYQNVTELIIKLISHNCGLTLKQAYSTLSQNMKYLAHMIVKGIKNSYQQIQNFLREFITNVPHIMYLCEKDPAKNTQFLLQIIKPTLISRDSSIALFGCQTLKAIIYESQKYNSKNLVYQLLSTQQLGFDFIYMGIKRHPQLSHSYKDFLHPLIQYTYKDFFEIHLKGIIDNDLQYIKVITVLLQGIIVSDQSKKCIAQSGLLKIWLKMCQQSFINQANKVKKDLTNLNKEQVQLASLELLCDLWKAYSSEMDQAQAQDLLMKGIQQLKRNTRKVDYGIKTLSLCRIFDFLDYLATQKNKLASIIYKKMIFLFVENHEDSQIRQAILQNFKLIFRKFLSIPLQFFLQPLLKQLITSQGVTYVLNIYDFEFFIQIFRHPRMQASYALNFLEYFTKLYSRNIIYSNLVIRVIELLASRFCEQQAITEYILRNVDANLNVYGMLVIGKKIKSKQYNKARQEQIVNNQKRSLIIELIKFYVKLENAKINQSLKQTILGLYVNWIDNKNYQDNGLYSILTLFGDVQQLTMKERINRQSNKTIDQGVSSSKSRAKLLNISKAFTPIKQFGEENQSSRNKNNSKLDNKNQRIQSRLIYDSFQENESDEHSKASAFSVLKVPRSVRRTNHNLSAKQIQVEAKTLEDIQLYRQKHKKQNQRRKKLQESQNQIIIPKVNAVQLMQRQISLGYSKLFNNTEIKSDNMLFQFDSVKKKHLKEETQFLNLDQQQQRDNESTKIILAKYQKYISNLFYKYTPLGNKGNRSPTQDKVFMSFTDLMKMLKEKNLNKIPKIIINQIITYINRKKRYNSNILVGIQQKQFNDFLIIFTNLYLKIDPHDKDMPFGYKVQQILLILFQNQTFAKQLFDKQSIKWFEDNKIQFLSQQQQSNIPIPEGYKKVINKDCSLNHNINAIQFNLSQKYENCFEILNEIFKTAIGINIFPSYLLNKQITRIVPLVKLPRPKLIQNYTQKVFKQNNSEDPIKEGLQVSFAKETRKDSPQNGYKKNLQKSGRSRSQKQFKNKIQLHEEEQAQKDKKKKQQQQYAKKLREDLQLLRSQKLKKQQEQAQKKQQIQKQKQKKLQERKKYLQENKKKLQQKKQQEEKQKIQKQQKQKIQKQKQKQLIKQRQKQLLQKQKQKLKQKKQKFQQKVKSVEKKNQILQKQKKKAQNKIDEVKNKIQQQKQKDKRLQQLLKDKNSEISQIVNSYQKQTKILFQQYWNWKTKKIQLQSIALIMKNFKISPEYLTPKMIADTYKIFSKGQSLYIQQFIELLIKFSFKSQKLKQQIDQSDIQFNPLLTQRLFKEKLRMKDDNYQQIIKMAKLQKI